MVSNSHNDSKQDKSGESCHAQGQRQANIVNGDQDATLPLTRLMLPEKLGWAGPNDEATFPGWSVPESNSKLTASWWRMVSNATGKQIW